MNANNLLLYFGLIAFIGFQNCSPAEFSVDPTNKANSNNDPYSEGGNPNDPGLSGGHFDFDTSHLVYAASQGDTDRHIHEYDDKFKTTQVDFFNMLDAGYTDLADVISPAQNFIITVANAELSPGAMIEINGSLVSSVDYQKKVDAHLAGQSLPQYSLSSLSSFKVKFNRDALNQGGLVPTQTGCVRDNDLTADGKYRNGALTIQIHDASKIKLDAKMRVASPDGGLLWEATIFWHKDGAGCL